MGRGRRQAEEMILPSYRGEGGIGKKELSCNLARGGKSLAAFPSIARVRNASEERKWYFIIWGGERGGEEAFYLTEESAASMMCRAPVQSPTKVYSL